MAHKSFETVNNIRSKYFEVSPGVTNALFVDTVGTENNILLRYFSGGTMLIIGSTAGTVGHTFQGATFSAAQLATLFAGNDFYIMGADAISIMGPARFYVAAIGATSTGCLIRGLNE